MKALICASWKNWGPLAVLLAAGWCAVLPTAARGADLTIGNYAIESKSRVGRTTWEYVLRAQVHNTGPAVRNVAGALTSTSAGASVVDGNLNFGNVAAGQTKASLDTFTLRQDRIEAFDPAALQWTITSQPDEPTGLDIEITRPDDQFLTRLTEVEVGGTIGSGVTSVTVNGVAATLGTGTFTATVPLREGRNPITAIARDGAGGEGQDTITVRVDTLAPLLNIENPRDGAVVSEAEVAVTGMVNDVLAGTVNVGDCEVIVNGVSASIANRSYEAQRVLLTRGENTLTAIARDAAGNEARRQIRVTYRDPAEQQRVRIASGNLQSGVINTVLPDPLVVEVLDSVGNPIAGQNLAFSVVRNDGVLLKEPQSGRELLVQTDENGLAGVQFRLGTRTGVGNNQVAVRAAGFAEEVVFCFTALTGDPVKIAPLAPETQVGATGQPLPLPWIVYVVDRGGNPVEGAAVAFMVVEGGGTVNGSGMVTLNTDADGRASVIHTLGPDAGINNHVLVAAIVGVTGDQASTTFKATAKASENPLDTRVSGLVLDNANRPMPNVLCLIEGTTIETVTDAQGLFVLHQVPVGPVRLLVDARDRGIPGEWHMLEFDLVTVAGQDNQVDRPIYMLPLDAENAKLAGGDEDVELRMKEIPGAVMRIKKGSVRGPNGERVMRVLWTQVNMERVPMPPPLGSQFMLAWTVQPPGLRFDPPAEICIPNMGAPAGQQVEIFSFDHDVAEFVAVGTATVTPDGAQMCSDPGFGVMKSGWGGCVPPPPPCTPVCGPAPQETDCVSWQTIPPASPCDCPTYKPIYKTGPCDDGDDCTENDKCENGACKGEKIEITKVEAKVEGQDEFAVCKDESVSFSVTVEQKNCPALKYEWDFGDGNTSNDQNPTHTYTTAMEYTVKVTVSCEKCPSAKMDDSVKVWAAEIELVTPAGDPVAAAKQSGDGQNEFTFSAANPGVLTMNLKAKVDPASAADKLKDKVVFGVEAVGASTMAWDGANPGGKASVSGSDLVATVTFTGLPADNSDFGTKKATLSCDGTKKDEESYEVFYPRDATNHPGGEAGSPNWYHYWGLALGTSNTRYQAGSVLYGEAPGMLHWSYTAAPDKTTVIIYDLAATEDPGDANADGGKKKTTGIDTFEDTYLHEQHHTVQIANADGIVGVVANTSWRYGWSWNQGDHNHWTVGADGAPGAKNADDDGDGTSDNHIVTGPGELGNGDDALLDDGTGEQWPLAFGARPPQPWAGGSAIEDECYNKEPDNENGRAALDWGDPGKQHKTINNYND